MTKEDSLVKDIFRDLSNTHSFSFNMYSLIIYLVKPIKVVDILNAQLDITNKRVEESSSKD